MQTSQVVFGGIDAEDVLLAAATNSTNEAPTSTNEAPIAPPEAPDPSVIQKSVSLKCEPSSEPLPIPVKWLFLSEVPSPFRLDQAPLDR